MGALLRVFAAAAAALFALSSFALTPPPAEERAPALWVVRDADSTLYIFGTVHLLRPGTSLGPVVEAARAEAEEVWTEIDMSSATTQEAGARMLARGLDPSRRLSSYLTPDQVLRLDQGLAAHGMTRERFETMRPWLAALILSLVPALAEGYAPEAGADQQIGTASLRQGQRMRFFETPDQQIDFLAGLSEATQRAFLADSINQLSGGAGFMESLTSVWSSGAEEALGEGVVEAMRASSPELYEALIVGRNNAWMRILEAELAGAGRDFVAVGAAHVAGPDGLVAQLRARGYTVERVSAAPAAR